MTNTANCATCDEKAHSDIAHRKICVNGDCDEYGRTYYHHEWMQLHSDKNKQPATVMSNPYGMISCT